MTRREAVTRACSEKERDVIVVGGGATGLGVAWDAATRGFSVLLLEAGDFGSGTSSRSTKLIHGGIRYLRQGHFGLVRESLRERSWLLAKAPSLVRSLRFVIPCRSFFEQAYYRLGTALYERLDGGPHSRWLTARGLQLRLPGLRKGRFRGGVDYWDAQFDDSRLALELVHQTHRAGGACLNYFPVQSLCRDGDRISGVTALDQMDRVQHTFPARIVVNATGVYSDRIRRMCRPGIETRIHASRGSHLVIRGDRLGSPVDALIIPRTPDGRVVFLIPWLGRTLVGTTEEPVEDPGLAPRASREEVDYLLDLAGNYLEQPLARSDIASVFSGYRPLLAQQGRTRTSQLPRDFEIEETCRGLISVLGGKWTTFRSMAEAAVNRIEQCLDRSTAGCRTREFSLRAFSGSGFPRRGSDPAPRVRLEGFPYSWGQVYQAIQKEMAVTLEDVLARRLRCLFLDVEASRRIAPEVAAVMAREQGRGESWIESELESFRRIAGQFEVPE